jgi:NADPH-dependent curcumin reductase CurA
MNKEKNTKIIVKSYPNGWVKESDFEIVESDLPILQKGQVLIKNQWLSLDPYMRGRLSPAKSYAASAQIGEVMVGQAAGVVVASESEKFKVGDSVLSYSGWQNYFVADSTMISLIDTSQVCASAYLGVLGMPGVTAWTGLIDICNPQPNETVLVDAATGAVGSVVGQLAKSLGSKVIGIAGGPSKCQYALDELGFDACIDHTSSTFKEQLAQAVPNGVDCVFENVGGLVFEQVLTLMNPFSRIALCGLVSEYNVPPYGNRQLRSILVNRIKVQGFIVTDKPQTWPGIVNSLKTKLINGELKYKEAISNGLASTPKAFIGMLAGDNFGKQLVKLF